MFECPYYRDCQNEVSKNSNDEYEREAEMRDLYQRHIPYDFQSGKYFQPDNNFEMNERDERDEIVFKKVKIELLKD